MNSKEPETELDKQLNRLREGWKTTTEGPEALNRACKHDQSQESLEEQKGGTASEFDRRKD